MPKNITVVIPTSPIQSHPDTAIIDETIATIRYHLPDSEIILQIDGVRKEQENFTERYNEYINRVLWKCLHEWENVLPLVFDEHLHQASMMRETMPLIHTDLILYVEHDTPLITDKKIDWVKCDKFIMDGYANTIRFHFEDVIPEAHKDLVMKTQDDFLQTYQWSQRPHLTTKVYYRELLRHFPESARTMIEDLFHGVVMNDYKDDGMLGWGKHRLWIYHPKGGIKRSYNLDGRGAEPKYEMRFK
jgi:hypothetical protein